MGTPVVRLVGLTKTFGAHRGVRNLHLEVGSAQVFGFLGPNGAGKTTTIRVLMGLHLATAGRAELFGRDVVTCGHRLRRRIGYVPGELALHPRLSGRETLDRISRLRGGVDANLRDQLAERFVAELDRPVRTLSKGNRQKIGLIAAFMHDPELLVLDEPTTGLDPLLQREFADLLAECVARGRTVFLSSHDLDEVQRLAHHVAIIREGRLIASDTVEGLRARAPRTVELTFRSPVAPEVFERVPQAEVTSCDAVRLGFRVLGEVGPLLEAAVPLGVVDVTARPADLDELFADLFSSPEASARAG